LGLAHTGGWWARDREGRKWMIDGQVEVGAEDGAAGDVVLEGMRF